MKSSFMAIVAGVLVAVALAFSLLRDRGDTLPIEGQLPPFDLVDSGGSAFTRETLAGKIWVADFIFTKCPGVCPVMSGQMQRMQAALERQSADDVHLVSISVDPKNDTLEALQAYAKRFSADPERWSFLTGERAALYDLVEKGFNLSVAERDEDPDGEGLITHSDRFILVDQQARIRGYYHGTDGASVDRLIADLDQLR